MISHKIALLLVAFLAVQSAFAAKNVKNLRTNQKISIVSENDQESTDLVQLQNFIDNLRDSQINKFNQEVLQTIMLKIKSGDNYDSLIQLLSTISNQLQIDQVADDQNYQTQSTTIQSQISSSETNLANLQSSQVELQSQLTDAQSTLSDLNSQQQLLNDKLEKVNNFAASLDQARAFDAENYAVRVQEQNAILNVINEIINELGNAIEQQINNGATEQTALVQMKNKMETLKSLTKVESKDVISNMIQLTMTFDVAQVQQIVSLLNQIKDAVSQSIAQDQNDETQAIADYQQMTLDIDSVQNSLNTQLVDLSTQISQTENLIESLKTQIANNETLIENAKTTLIQLNDQLTNLTSVYQSDKAERAQTQDTVNTVQQKIGSIQGTIQTYS